MKFLSPVWLIALAPWAAVVIYLLWGRRRQEGVPFLALWMGPVEGPRPRRRVAAPPLALALLILAMLVALLGAARPVVSGLARGKPITIILDRGATMSAAGLGGTRYVEAASALEKELPRLGAGTPVEAVDVPGLSVTHTDAGDWVGTAAKLPQTALDTSAMLRAEVARRLAQGDKPVVVVSDLALPENPRLVQVSPRTEVRNVGIILLAARETPRPQIMVRVRNATDATGATLRVTAGGRDTSQEIELPAGGATRDYFVDVERLGDVVRAALSVADDFPADDVGWVAREGSPPRVEAVATLPAELRRMVDVYAAARAPAADAARVTVAMDPAALPQGARGVVVQTGPATAPVGAPVEVRPHPVTRNTRWEFPEAVRLAEAPAAGWTPVVTIGGRTAVAVRDTPAPQVWIGIDAEGWARRPEYVVFWADVFDWLGGAATRFTSYPVARMEGAWRMVERAGAEGSPPVSQEPGLWPGLYERVGDGARRAVNAGDIRFSAAPQAAWQTKLASLASGGGGAGGGGLARGLLLAAVVFAALGAMSWKGRNLTAFSARRTVPG